MAKNFSWSFSKSKNFETCPKRHYEVDLAKNYSDTSEALDWGNDVHNALAAAMLHKAGLPESIDGRDRVTPAALPDTMTDYQKWIDIYADPGLPGTLLVEQKFSITKDFQPCGWSDWNRAWFRAKGDAVRILGPVARAMDWKTGAVKHDSRQLMLLAQCIFAKYPAVQRIKTEFVWLKEDCVTPEVFDRATIAREWPPVLAVVEQMVQAAATLNYPPKPGKLCRAWCPVMSCPYHGKGVRR